MATEWDYHSAWQDNEGNEDTGYWDYNGYNYAMTADHNCHALAMHYSMMMVRSKKKITIGPRYFPTAMCDDSDDDEQEANDRQRHHRGAQFNMQMYSKCMSTRHQDQT